MTFETTDTAIRTTILAKLKEIEQKEQVKILHAVESGSRAWGLASPDSDYDVRFIYIRHREDYLRLEEIPDFIDWELNEVLDINGWDITKALRHFHRSNATLYEWCYSPIVYASAPQWAQVEQAVRPYFSCRASMYHYYGTANKNFHTYLKGEQVNYKKYFYVLRPLLACQWISQRQTPPPVLFGQLADALLDDELRPMVETLTARKQQMLESGQGPHFAPLDQYIERQLGQLKTVIDSWQEERLTDWQALDALFLSLVGQMD